MSKVQWVVRETPCADHPDKEWLTLTVDGCELMALCTGALGAIAACSRGRELLMGENRAARQQGVRLKVRERPCNRHEHSEWLTLTDDGDVLFSGCEAALNSLASLNRGRDLVGLFGSLGYEQTTSEEEKQTNPINPHV